MITVAKLKQILELLPGNSNVSACEAKDVGLSVSLPNGKYLWIRARHTPVEDDQNDFLNGFNDIGKCFNKSKGKSSNDFNYDIETI